MYKVSTADQWLFVYLAYAAIAVFFIGSIARYSMRGFSVSSLSTQFLENRKHFWGLVPFHYGILWVLAGHMVALLIPRGLQIWNGQELRLTILEVTGFAAALMAFFGLAQILVRRMTNEKVRAVTNRMDVLLYAVLMIQIISGMVVAVRYPWGSQWFTTTATPYVWSLVTFQPDPDYIAVMPWEIKFHIVNAWVFVMLIPFTRMMHALVAPFPYLWRRVQVVRWYPETWKGRGAR